MNAIRPVKLSYPFKPSGAVTWAATRGFGTALDSLEHFWRIFESTQKFDSKKEFVPEEKLGFLKIQDVILDDSESNIWKFRNWRSIDLNENVTSIIGSQIKLAEGHQKCSENWWGAEAGQRTPARNQCRTQGSQNKASKILWLPNIDEIKLSDKHLNRSPSKFQKHIGIDEMMRVYTPLHPKKPAQKPPHSHLVRKILNTLNFYF